MTAPVAINARAAVRTEIGGVERVARQLAAELPALNPARYRVIAPRPALAHRSGHAWEQLALPVLSRGSRLILSPANFAPVASRRSVVYIHDVAPFVGRWYSTTYSRWHRAMAPLIARRARLVLTISTVSRDQIVQHLGVDPARVAIATLGVDDRFRDPAGADAVGARYGLERPYVLAVGTDLPRKNLALLDRLAPALDDQGLDVVLAGSTRPYMPTGTYRARSLGYVAEDELPGLYAGAAVLAMPSLHEGLGLPVLEAMAAGTPVVSSDRGALPETCGDAALVVDPDDHEAFAAALVRAALDPGEHERLAAAGRERSAGFTWRRTAERVDQLLEPLLEG